MTENRSTGYGMQLHFGDGGNPEVFTRVAGLTEVNPPKEEAKTVDVTEHRIAADPDFGSLEFISDPLKDHGEVTFTVNNVQGDGTQAALHALMGTTANFKAIYPAAVKTVAFKGILTKWEPKTPKTGAWTIDGTTKVTGKPIES